MNHLSVCISRFTRGQRVDQRVLPASYGPGTSCVRGRLLLTALGWRAARTQRSERGDSSPVHRVQRGQVSGDGAELRETHAHEVNKAAGGVTDQTNQTERDFQCNRAIRFASSEVSPLISQEIMVNYRVKLFGECFD